MAIPASIERYLKDHHVAFTPILHPPAYTAQEEAAATHTPGRSWAKTVVCIADGVPILAVLPADRDVDEQGLAEVACVQSVRLAREVEFAALYPGIELGAVPPLGPLFTQRVYLDRSLVGQRHIAFHGGTHIDAIRMPMDEFVALVQPIVGDFSHKVLPRHYGA